MHSRHKRPERQLYVPPAKRTTSIPVVAKEKTRNKHSLRSNNNILHCIKNNVEKPKLLLLQDVLDIIYNLNLLPYHLRYLLTLETYTKFNVNMKNVHKNCVFRRLIQWQSYIYINNRLPFYRITNLSKNSHFYWEFYVNQKSKNVYNEYNLSNHYQNCFDGKPVSILVNKSLPVKIALLEEIINQTDLNEIDDFKLSDSNCDNCDLVDLSAFDLGHYYIIMEEGNEYLYECQESHDPYECYKNKIIEFKNSKQINNNIDLIKTDVIKTDLNKSHVITKEIIKNQINSTTQDQLKEHDEENEIVRRTKENKNKKSRPIIKYIDSISNEDRLLNKSNNISHWEDLFDDNGKIQEELFSEIMDDVGNDVAIVNASADYSAYKNKSMEDLEHVVELYNFPASLETHDLIQAFSDINSDAMYIKWVDDTHALLVLGSYSQAQKAISLGNSLIKVRPITSASALSIDVANKFDLKPAMKRPQTNLQTARRLITTHLGTKSKMSKEQLAREKQDLINARQLKKKLKQNEKDAWDGNLRSVINCEPKTTS